MEEFAARRKAEGERTYRVIVQHELYGAQLHQLPNATICKGGVKEAAESAENFLQCLQSTFQGKVGRGLNVCIIQYVLASLPFVPRATTLHTSLL